MKVKEICKHFYFILFLIVSFSSCGFNEPVREYFEFYTENAAIVRHEYPSSSYPIDKYGNICIPSSDDFIITFYMRNPKNYTLIPTLLMDDTNVQNIAKSPDRIFLNQNGYDKSILTMKIEQNLLAELDGSDDGVNLSSLIGLQEDISKRIFDSYHFNLRCNSIPEPVLNLTALQDNLNNKYVIAFEMPNISTGIHKDVESIIINGTRYDAKTDINSSPFTRTYNSNWVKPNSIFGFSPRPVYYYYETGVNFTTNDVPFTVTLEDKAGLSADSTVTISSEQLSRVITPDFSAITANEETGYASLVFNSPTTTTNNNSAPSGISVYYRVYKTGSSTVMKQGYGINNAIINLPVGSYRIETWAHKVGYIDSDITEKTNVIVTGFVYVKPSYSGLDSDGSREKPFTTMNAAFDATTFDIRKIYILEDIMEPSINFSGADVEIKAESTKKINGTITINPPGKSLIMNTAVLIDEVILQSGSLLKLRNISASNELLTKVTYDTGTSGTLSSGIVIVENANTSSSLPASIFERIRLTNPGYYIGEQNGKGVATPDGILLETKIISGAYTVTLDGLVGNAASVGDTLTVTAIEKNGSNIDLTDANISIEVLTEGTIVQSQTPIEKENNCIELTTYAYTNPYVYTLSINFEDVGYKITAQTTFTKNN